VFGGESIHALDAKWRVFLPKRIAELLPRDGAGQLYAVLTRGLDSCINLFTQAGYEAEVARLSRTVFAGPDGRAAQRLFFASAFTQTLDASGRLLIPEKLRAIAGLEEREDLALLGVGNHVEIWRAKEWQSYESRHEGDWDELVVRHASAIEPREGS
jgi:MraZ protein